MPGQKEQQSVVQKHLLSEAAATIHGNQQASHVSVDGLSHHPPAL